MPIVVRVPVSKLTTLAQGDGHQGLFTLFMAMRDAEGGITPVRQTSVPIRVSAADLQAASGRHFVYKVDTLLKPVDVEVAIAVRDDLGGTIGYRVEKVSARRRL